MCRCVCVCVCVGVCVVSMFRLSFKISKKKPCGSSHNTVHLFVCSQTSIIRHFSNPTFL